MVAGAAHWLITQETRALLSRLVRLRPFALQETMVPAAALTAAASSAIESYLERGRQELRARIAELLAWLDGEGRSAGPAEAQRRLTLVRLRFNVVLSQLDLFADALSQRSERETGVWLAGLEEAARDALDAGDLYDAPPLVCYLDRGPGGAIRRARTRLPGGGLNPVAIIRVPRERMVGSGIASSLMHEVGHQGAALLDLAASLRPALRAHQAEGGRARLAWSSWERWLSEILADLWAVARVGVAATLGLIGVVSLPRLFVFRRNLDDPHPTPWLRVKLSCALGDALYPHPQWERLAAVWEALYPTTDLDGGSRAHLELVAATVPALAALLVGHRPPRLRGRSLGEALALPERAPARLAALHQRHGHSLAALARLRPAAAFAVFGQARIDGSVTPEHESEQLAELIQRWALAATVRDTAACVQRIETRTATGLVA
jgi:hypothetical protein